MNTNDNKINPKVVYREYKDSEGNIQTEYKDSEGNIHTEYTESQTNTHSYENGYVDGNIAERQSEDVRGSHADKNTSKGLLIGVIVTCVAGLTAGTIYFLTKQNSPEPAPVVIMPISKTNPKPTPSPPQVKVVEKPVVTIVKVPVPQAQTEKPVVTIVKVPVPQAQTEKPVVTTVKVPVPQAQTDKTTVNINTNPSPSNPPSKPVAIETRKPEPIAVTPSPKPEPVEETPTSGSNRPVVSPTLIKTDSDLKTEILKQFEDNLPNNQLIVEVKNGDVKVSGTAATPEQLQGIQPLLKSIEGIGKVEMKATVALKK
jgi:hypothetical protein